MMTDVFPRTRAGLALAQVCRNPELMEALAKTGSARGNTPETVTVELIDRVPVNRRIQATISELSRDSGDPTLPKLLVTFRDLTQQDKIEQMRVDFVANASHELRTPLASLLGYVETLQGPARDDAAARERFLGIMWNQAQRMTRLIDDLLSLSRIEMRLHLPPKDVVDLNEVAAYVVQTLEPIAETAHASIVLNKLEGPARIRGDREEVALVLQNLVQNAIKYGRDDGGRVEVTVGRGTKQGQRAPRLEVVIADNGQGIAPEHLPRLTERFYRASVASSRAKGGTGLGLAIVKNIVLRHRGDLKIASELGKGSTFTVIFDELVA
jgi:two-component system phosphate regulon sensor histidine kinase PhoR